MNMRRLATAAYLLLGVSCVAAAQDYPGRAVTIVVPYPAGGATDMVARIVAQGLSNEFRQSFMVENRSGGAGMIGVETAARAQPDGYTLLVSSTGPTTISPLLAKGGEFKPLERLEPIARLASAPAILLVRNGLPVKSVDDLIKLSKASPGALNMASAGNGSLQRLVGEHLQDKLGIKWTHVPFRGSAPALNELVAGRVDVMIDVVPSAAPLVSGGQLRALGVMALKRARQLPDVPTLEEQGHKGFDFSGWHALLAPKGTAKPVVDRLNRVTNGILASADTETRLEAIGAQADGGTPDQLRDRIAQELRDWASVIQITGITSVD